jgi:hypothetical protein
MALVIPSETDVETFKMPSDETESKDLRHTSKSIVKGKGKQLE